MSIESFLQDFAPICERVGKHYGIPHRLLLSQCAVESGWGAKTLAQNNFTGMKWTLSMWKMPGPKVKAKENQNTKKPTIEPAVFVAYVSPEACVIHLAETLKFSGNYVSFQRGLRDGESIEVLFAQLARVYCTDAKYAETLGKVYATIQSKIGPNAPSKAASGPESQA